jgi:hypothetical protein
MEFGTETDHGQTDKLYLANLSNNAMVRNFEVVLRRTLNHCV